MSPLFPNPTILEHLLQCPNCTSPEQKEGLRSLSLLNLPPMLEHPAAKAPVIGEQGQELNLSYISLGVLAGPEKIRPLHVMVNLDLSPSTLELALWFEDTGIPVARAIWYAKRGCWWADSNGNSLTLCKEVVEGGPESCIAAAHVLCKMFSVQGITVASITEMAEYFGLTIPASQEFPHAN